jgi:hypothetical protein
MVGRAELIPRWDTRSTGPCALSYYIQTKTFKNATDLSLAKGKLAEAAEAWNDVGYGVSFHETTAPAQAHFDVIYGTGECGDIAMTFGPHNVDMFYIYETAFSDAGIRAQLANNLHPRIRPHPRSEARARHDGTGLDQQR